jgi:hypothetical protein
MENGVDRQFCRGLRSSQTSLKCRRAANAQLGKTELRFGKNFFFGEQIDCGKNRRALMARRSRSAAVRSDAERTRCRFCLVGVVVRRLRHHRPQHQRQAEPRQTSHTQSHSSFLAVACFGLFGPRFLLDYNGCNKSGNCRTRYYVTVVMFPGSHDA